MEEKRPYPVRPHVHEVLGSTKVSGCCDNAHNHRFATVTGNAIPCDGGHIHEIKFTTDSCDGHTHEFCGTTSKSYDVGNGHHVHSVKAQTTKSEEHKHEFVVATLIEDPTCK